MSRTLNHAPRNRMVFGFSYSSALIGVRPCSSVVLDSGYNFQTKVTILHFGDDIVLGHNPCSRSVRKLTGFAISVHLMLFGFFYMGIPGASYDDNSLCVGHRSWQYTMDHGLNSSCRQIQTGRKDLKAMTLDRNH